MNQLIVSPSPHVHGTESVEKNMYSVIIALLPTVLIGLVFFGWGALIVLLTSICSCALFEWGISKYILKTPPTLSDGSAIVTGLLLGLNLPSNLPLWMVIIGAIVAIGVAKMTFGGLGNNPFNPALVGRCFMLISFPAAMTSWPLVGQWTNYLDAQTGATPLAIMKAAIKMGDPSLLQQLPNATKLLLGYQSSLGGGAVGELCALALLLGFVYLLWRKVITYHIPVAIVGTVFIFCEALHLCNPIYASPLTEILSGGLLLGAIFMATDYVTSPMTHRGQIVYGISIGVLTVIIRNWGSYPEGMSFAILIMNAFTPLINIYIKPQRFGKRLAK